MFGFGSMLQNFYKKGSLKNGEGGFTFTLSNSMMPAQIQQILKVAVDREAVDLAQVRFRAAEGGEWLPATDISKDKPVEFKRGGVVEVNVQGNALAAGAHNVYVKVYTREFKEIKIEADDHIA